MIETPEQECPVSTMPEARQEEDDEGVADDD